jgi:hypothetical protein
MVAHGRRRLLTFRPAPRLALQRLEKAVGALPLSLRVFYEVVGAVDLIGRHPTLASANGTFPPDPLVVSSVAEVESEVGSWDEKDVLMLAPDDLHKANTSGGTPTRWACLTRTRTLPFSTNFTICSSSTTSASVSASAGCPGYEGQGDVPVEIDTLRAGLQEF